MRDPASTRSAPRPGPAATGPSTSPRSRRIRARGGAATRTGPCQAPRSTVRLSAQCDSPCIYLRLTEWMHGAPSSRAPRAERSPARPGIQSPHPFRTQTCVGPWRCSGSGQAHAGLSTGIDTRLRRGRHTIGWPARSSATRSGRVSIPALQGFVPRPGAPYDGLMTISPELEQLVEEARLFNEQAATYMPAMSFDSAEDILRMREFMDAPDSPFVGFMGQSVLPVGQISIPGPAGLIPARVIRPDEVRAVHLDIHGGAWMIGSARMDDVENDELARACGVATVSIDYRMAPEHDIADSMEDCEAAALWLSEHAPSEFGADRLLIGGGSAGAHLAVMALLRLRDRHQAADRFIGANLVYGCYDLSGTPSSRLRRAESWVLRPELFEAVHEYVMHRKDAESLRDPALSPLYASLSGLVPALFSVGMLD